MAARKPTIAELDEILARPDEDFIRIVRRNGSVDALMRPRHLPQWAWRAFRFLKRRAW